MQQAWDKNGRIYYIDDNGNKVQPKSTLNAFQKLGNDFKALKTNVKNAIDNLGVERSHTYFAPFNELKNAYESGFIGKRELPYLAQGRADQEIREANKQQKASNIKNAIGTTISGLSAHPILNIPYVGTGLGGAVYELGQGIASGDNVGDIIDRTGQGFIVGETVGAIPYVGRGLGKTKVGQAVTDKATQGLSKLAETPLGHKVGNWASKAEDVLMSDIAQFIPNKQTVYHGSPYDFAKFSNEAIGTGEGAQAHGMGHYAAKGKDVAQRYADNVSNNKPIEIKYKGEKYKVNFNEDVMDWDIQGNVENLTPTERSLFEKIDSSRNLDHIKELELQQIDRMKRMQGRKNRFRDAQKSKDIINILDSGDLEILPTNKQLYKLSIPKDDVMLREGADSYTRQPKVQKALNQLFEDTGLYKEWDEANGFNRRKKFATDETILYDIQRDLGKTPQEANDLLNNYGIKGISYNGGIDGEANVIFNPDDIQILRKYYNQLGLSDLLDNRLNFGGLPNYFKDNQ